MPSISEVARGRFDALVDDLLDTRDIVRAPMFGMPAAKVVGGKVFMSLFGDDLVVKLGPDERARARELQGAAAFDPMGGRPMKEWVLLPAALHERWGEFARAAEEFVRG